MKLPDGPLIAFYGDDFTGSTAVLEALAFAGLKTILFFDNPTREMLQSAQDCRAIGIAGLSRAKSPDWMDEHLSEAFKSLKQIDAALYQYKICSTFDSAPHVGSIGKAIEIGQTIFPSKAVPVLTAAPAIGRWQIFGNLFARMGKEIYRIDRHPVMMRHPVTPMSEADLTRHLAKQTSAQIALVDVAALNDGRGINQYSDLVDHGAKIILIDGVDETTMACAGEVIWGRREQDRFVAGSQGLDLALISYWRSQGFMPQSYLAPTLKPVERIAAVSGSCSIITANQIEFAAAHGFETIRANSIAVLDERSWNTEIERCVAVALQAIAKGRDALIYTAKGADDEHVKALNEVIALNNIDRDVITERLGTGLGHMLDQIIERSKLTRAIVSGGDSSGQACIAMGLAGVTAAAMLEPSAPLCRALSSKPHLDGLEIALKGGQMGSVEFFLRAKG